MTKKIEKITCCMYCGWRRPYAEKPPFEEWYCYRLGNVKGELQDIEKFHDDCPLLDDEKPDEVEYDTKILCLNAGKKLTPENIENLKQDLRGGWDLQVQDVIQRR